MIDGFRKNGWCRFDFDEALHEWVRQVLPAARQTVAAAAEEDYRCAGTWLVGINALPNDPTGAVPGGQPLEGTASEFVRKELGLGSFGWDRGQVSVVYPGYPRQGATESDAVFRFRCERDAAHIDGILHEGPRRRRFLRTYHGFILGVPLVDVGPGMSPLALWEGSHEVIRQGFRRRFGDLSSDAWPAEDVTEAYQQIRKQVFETCRRVEIPAVPGEAYLLHRLTLHGISPWAAQDAGPPDGRMVAYFRPDNGTPESWLNAD